MTELINKLRLILCQIGLLVVLAIAPIELLEKEGVVK